MLPARGATATEKYGIWDGVSAPSFFQACQWWPQLWQTHMDL